jgi:AcrR family transcriptional regulator
MRGTYPGFSTCRGKRRHGAPRASPEKSGELARCTIGVYYWYTLPLPRYYRLSEERQEQILQTAREHISLCGAGGVSYNKIISDCGISKTSAYHYFDGRDDLLAEVTRDSLRRVVDALGPWRAAKTPATFWRRLRGTANELRDFVAASPDHLAVLKAGYGSGTLTAVHGDEQSALDWFDALLENGAELGVVRQDVDRGLLRLATVSLFRAIDAWALGAMSQDGTLDLSPGFRLLAGLWTKPKRGKK